MTLLKKITSRISLALMALAARFKRSPKPTSDDFEKADFKTSTQRLGLRFTEKMRNFFRHKWIKKT